MTKKRWKASTKQFASHIDPHNEEEIKWIKIELENNVKRIIKLIKSNVNQGSRDSNQKRKAELIQLVEDFHKQYQSLYSLYDNLKGEVRKKCRANNDSASSSSSSSGSSLDSESYFSPEESAGVGGRSGGSSGSDSSSRRRRASRSQEEELDLNTVEAETPPGSDDVILKDTLTSTTEVNVDDSDSAYNDDRVPRPEELIIKDLGIQYEESESKFIKECSILKEKLVEKEEHLLCITKNYEERIAGLVLELQNSNSLTIELEENIKTKSDEVSRLSEESKTTFDHIKCLEVEIESLSLQKAALEEKLQSRSVEMERKLKEKEDELSNLLRKHEDLQQQSNLSSIERSDQVEALTKKINSLQQEVGYLSNKKAELERSLDMKSKEVSECHLKLESMEQKISLEENSQKPSLREGSLSSTEKEKLERKLVEQENTIKKLKKQVNEMQDKYEEANMNFQNAERKIDEMLEELRKKYEDSLRILSRRIRVAEQLHAENKEWYLKTRETYEKENNVGIKKIQEMSIAANDALASLDTVSLDFEKCTSNFINRISSASCELNFARDWVSRKHKAMAQIKVDMNCLISQLDEKEAEILVYREKVWKCENKVRDLEKIIKESEDSMCDLKEEKREAIRQLCVWIDYHRSRCDYYRKMLTEVGFVKAP
ncbi:unnamed protein product [Cuscuta epithymum]|uniref:NAB domain-containing protein n=1 Tax=Cuscuta epithymum TaxID=186058 RepID=A0AAV0EPB4_9ASTE|nr:unnamed protein product [Cuscuta epithymum]